MADVVEGVHYIFDRYAYLGLEQDASKEDIKKAIKDKRAENHPDRLIRAGKEIQDAAKKVRDLVDKCEAILMDDELRPLYDQRLAEFGEKRPHLISREGHAIIDPGQEWVNIDALLDDNEKDFSALEKQAATMIQFDPERLEMMKTLWQTDTENPALRKAYKKELSTKLVFISIMESIAWQKAGIEGKRKSTNGMVYSTDDYTEAVEREIKAITEQRIDTALEERKGVVQIGMAQAPLLLTDGSKTDEDGQQDDPSRPVDKDKALTTMNAEIMEKMQVKARQNFDDRAKYIRGLAQQKQDTLSELVSLTDFEYLHEVTADTKRVDIYVSQEIETDDGSRTRAILAGFKMTFDGETADINTPLMDRSGMLETDFRNQDHEHPVVLVTRNEEIEEFMTEIFFTGEKVAEKLESLQAEAKQQHRPAPRRKPGLTP